jgi:hypothetical protein
LTDIVVDSFSCLIDELRELELNEVEEEKVEEKVEENEL